MSSNYAGIFYLVYSFLPSTMKGERGKANWEFRLCNKGGKKEQTYLFTFSHLLP